MKFEDLCLGGLSIRNGQDWSSEQLAAPNSPDLPLAVGYVFAKGRFWIPPHSRHQTEQGANSYRMGIRRLRRASFCLKQSIPQQCPSWALPARGFATNIILGSGHNRWSKIKHDKGKEDALKSKARSLLSQEIYNASKC